ncbi:hypothetical protein ACJIZ3_024354 [Penstemon smallii]|uniref:non-specific serine/threonine protein kinase n=1 Tax=Penstemon smallii TaxID=265156 RepID=A0ABD3TUR0_9LAMI
MEIQGRRSDYTLLSQIPDEPPYHQSPTRQQKFTNTVGGAVVQLPIYYESHSAEKNKLNSGRASSFDWDVIDRRIGTAAFGLQRQSSGSSFGESSISVDYCAPEGSFSHLSDGGEYRCGVSSSSKSWAQQMEESYQLQLALALRLSSEASRANDPTLLDHVADEFASAVASMSASAEAISHRFWVNGCLSYFDKIPDGFYSIYGMDTYVWAVCSDLRESGCIPSIESLKTIDPAIVTSIEVVSVDRRRDPSLTELHNRIHALSSSCNTTKEVVDQLAKLVCNHMGGVASNGEDDLVIIWRECSNNLKDCLGSVLLPIGSISTGVCRHRSLLFKVLADNIGLPCRIARGCMYCSREDASSCLVRFGVDREYLIDLVEKPGCLSEPDSLLNGPSTISISSPLCFPRFRQVGPIMDFRSLAKQYFSDFQSLNLVFDDSLTAGTVTHGDSRTSYLPSSSNQEEIFNMPPFPTNSWIKIHGKEQLPSKPSLLDPSVNTIRDTSFGEGSQIVQSKPSELAFDVEDLNIPWSDLILKEEIGAGSFGTVHRAEWNGCEVAVKILMGQDLHADQFEEFLQEVSIMKSLRHPNIVLFMGVVTEPPNLSIVTEYLSRGSLFRLLHKTGAKEALDERRRLSMAYDIAKGMNYLHKHNPPIVHRDLKSPNLLVDRNYTVKVCDFGLSRLKANTFLSSKSAAGTPEWMAPEVVRDDPSNEKSDVYSFGVVLWEIVTLQQPWGNLNPEQVVAAVGFEGKRLEIPRDINPEVAAMIEACWTNEPWKRPSFSYIMESLRSLINSPPATQRGRGHAFAHVKL